MGNIPSRRNVESRHTRNRAEMVARGRPSLAAEFCKDGHTCATPLLWYPLSMTMPGGLWISHRYAFCASATMGSGPRFAALTKYTRQGLTGAPGTSGRGRFGECRSIERGGGHRSVADRAGRGSLTARQPWWSWRSRLSGGRAGRLRRWRRDAVGWRYSRVFGNADGLFVSGVT